MLYFSAYLYDKDIDNYGIIEPFLVHSCGRNSFSPDESFDINRPNGREDYQIIYIHKGCGHFFIERQDIVLDEGKIILYYPNEIQRYLFCHTDEAEFYWLHFSGSNVMQVLHDSCFTTRIMDVGMSPSIPLQFEGVIRELMFKRTGYKQLSNLKGQELIWSLAREFSEQHNYNFCNKNERMESLIEKMNLEYNKPLSISELACEYGCSPSWFIKEFQHYTGQTPKQYLTTIRLGRAKDLLYSSNYRINEISLLCGFDDPLYFSRVFQNAYHLSPSEYRKIHS